MTDYILRKDAVQCASDVATDFLNDGLYSAYSGANTVGEWLKDIPAADVRPVFHGKWIAKGIGFPPEPHTVCSCCGYDIDLAVYRLVELYDGSVSLKPFKPNFCHNCGADMMEVKTNGD